MPGLEKLANKSGCFAKRTIGASNARPAFTALKVRLVVSAAALCASAQGLSQVHPVYAQQAPPAGETSAVEAKDSGKSLVTRQDAVALRFRRFEKTLLQMAEFMRKTDPERAELLVRAIGRSKEERIAQQLEQTVTLLGRDQYGDAIDRQEQLVTGLKALLVLLQSEDRKSEIGKESERLKDLLRDVTAIISKQKDVRARTERGNNPQELIPSQEETARKTGRLIDKIDAQDAQRNQDPSDDDASSQDEPGEGKSEEGQPSEGQPSEGQPSEGQPSEGQPSEGQPSEGQPSEGQPSEGQPSEGQPSEGQPSEGQPSEGQPSQGSPNDESKKTPGRQQIEEARREMERAIEELKQQNRDGASDRQDEAIARLQQAKEKLEEILRQLREEERELLLAALEARFQKMLASQLLIYNSTVNLSGTASEQWTSRHFGRSRELANQEDELAREADKALNVLREEGSSVAFPEAVEQLREDMRTVAGRLARNDVGELTQTIEQDIIEALEELIDALQREMEEKKDEQQQSQQSPAGQPERVLVDQLAELKMLRSLQIRINRRTKQLGEIISGEQATQADVVERLQELGRRQERVQDATYSIAVGKNR
jgi:hypothetical protein